MGNVRLSPDPLLCRWNQVFSTHPPTRQGPRGNLCGERFFCTFRFASTSAIRAPTKGITGVVLSDKREGFACSSSFFLGTSVTPFRLESASMYCSKVCGGKTSQRHIEAQKSCSSRGKRGSRHLLSKRPRGKSSPPHVAGFGDLSKIECWVPFCGIA